MASYNKFIALGNLTRDPEMRHTPNGTAVCNFSLATNHRYNTQDGTQRDEVCYIDIVTFGRQAETASQYLNKGSQVMVEGRLQWKSWETEDGQKRSKHECVANSVQFLFTRNDSPGGGPTDAIPPGLEPELGDIPF